MDAAHRATIRDDVLRELGTGATDLTPDIERARKQTLRDIASFHQWSWLEQVPVTLTAGASNSYITVPEYLEDDILMYQAAEGHEIKYISPAEYVRLVSTTSSTTANPDFYTVIDERFYFYMTIAGGSSVTAIGTIRCDQIEDDDTNVISGIETRMPDVFRKAMIWGILEQVDVKESKQFWHDKFYMDLEIKKDRDESKTSKMLRVQHDTALLNAKLYTFK